jgi:hypothetical protein
MAEKTGQEEQDSPGAGLDRDLVFHYSRERRLERASPAVRALYENPGGRGGGGLIRALKANPSGKWVFFSILIVAAFMFLYTTLNRQEKGRILEGNSLEASAITVSGGTLVLLRKKAAGSDYYTGPVELAFSVFRSGKNGEIPPIEARQIVFSPEKEEEFQFSLPIRAETFILVIQAGSTVRTLRFRSR